MIVLGFACFPFFVPLVSLVRFFVSLGQFIVSLARCIVLIVQFIVTRKHGGGCAGILRGGGIVSEPVGFARGIQTG